MKTKKQLFAVIACLCLVLLFAAEGSASWKSTKGGGKRYYISSTEYVKSAWHKVGKYWYYFDSKGLLKTGRFKVDNQYYYCTKSKGRITRKQVGSYYYGSDGVMVKNRWIKIRKHYFYFGSDGRLKTGKFTIDGKTYYCSKKTGRAENKKVGSYYFGSGGVMVKDRWVKNFYYGKTGKMVTGRFTAKDGKVYYCDKKTGKVVSRWKDKRYYGKDGVMAVSKWINGSYVNEKGVITKGNKNPKNPPSSSDVRWLAAITYLEAGNQSYYGKKCVASVVMNRVNSKKFPGTIKSVLYQSGQFTPAMTGSLGSLYYSKQTIQSQCVNAAKYVLEHGSVLKGYYYFNNSYGTLKIGDHYFS